MKNEKNLLICNIYAKMKPDNVNISTTKAYYKHISKDEDYLMIDKSGNKKMPTMPVKFYQDSDNKKLIKGFRSRDNFENYMKINYKVKYEIIAKEMHKEKNLYIPDLSKNELIEICGNNFKMNDIIENYK